MEVKNSVDNMTNKALQMLGINKNEFKNQIDKIIDDTTNQILHTTKKGKVKAGGLTVLAGGPNGGGVNYIGGQKKTNTKKPRSSKQLKRDKLLKWCRGKGMTMKQSNDFIRQHGLMDKEINF